MATNNAINLKVTNNADGFDVTGGTTPRKLTLSGGDVAMTGSGSATITFPSSTGTLYATANTDVALGDGGTGASLSAPAGDRIFFYDQSAASTAFLTPGSGITITGTTITASASAPYQAYDYIVYVSGGSFACFKTADGSTLSTNADASVVLQAAVDACDASSGTGGRIYVQPGTYTMATVVTIQGDNTTDSKGVSFHGSGIQATIFKPAVNVTAFTVSNRAKVSMKDFAIIVRGSGNGITSTNSSVGERAFWLSEFRNIYIYDDGSSTAHSAWGMNLGNPFRSVFENIDMNQVKNGLKLEALSTGAAYNPGDCTFTRLFIELTSGASSGTGIELAGTSTGTLNQMTFNIVELIGAGTGQTAILSSGTHGCNHTNWIGTNIEQFATLINIPTGRNNYFDCNYIITIDAVGTTYFQTGSGAYGNMFSAKYLDTNTQTVTFINDAQTDATQRNSFVNITLQGSATATTYTRTDATYLENIKDNIDGTFGVPIMGNSSVATNAVTINATAGFFTDTTDINAGASRTAITLTNRAIRSSSIVSCFMGSAPDTNAMLVASVAVVDGSASIVIRNVGSGNQTSTFTMGFIVKQ